MNMVKSRLLGRNTLSSTVIGVIPKDPSQQQEVSYGIQSSHPLNLSRVLLLESDCLCVRLSHLSPEDIVRTTKLYAAKLGMMVHHHDLEC